MADIALLREQLGTRARLKDKTTEVIHMKKRLIAILLAVLTALSVMIPAANAVTVSPPMRLAAFRKK